MAAVKISFFICGDNDEFFWRTFFQSKIITEARPFEAPVLPRLKLKSVKILGLAAA